MTDDRPHLDVWFDFASTYSYPAVARVESLATASGVALRWRPFLLGPIFVKQGWDTSPFNLYPTKGRYMWRDIERLCAAADLPFRHPSSFPRMSILASRVAILAGDAPWCGDFVRAVFTANFAEDRDVANPAVIAAILADLGQDAAALIEAAQTPEAKARLRDETAEAEALGIFGAPSFVAAGELFWGNDRLEQALAWARSRA
jgi:2-hydroxychromene-2-carboxylate isomerase